ncbi:hypothetical protein TrST_g11995 [Triparma strigata]|uniref:PNPLA domain-containing protein n=1 Tax=Triparma strigata TaxID=1606541 RepID=A0A9W7E560_9STRA|nr:hypothetical protein TrST_g11995 [Triparma strigata]
MELSPPSPTSATSPSPTLTKRSRFSSCRNNPKKTCCCVFTLLILLPPLLLYVYVLIYRLTLSPSTSRFVDLLKVPPHNITLLNTNLRTRASNLIDEDTVYEFPEDLDLVISGGGFLSYYSLGVSQVLSELISNNRTRVHRYSGASAGAQSSFKLIVMGEDLHFVTSLSYGLIFEEYSSKYNNMLNAAITADWHWRALADYMEDEFLGEEALERLTEKVYISITLLFPWSNKLISKYTSKSQAKSAFLATGSMFINYEGKLASDGGATDCAPRFKDNSRQQLIVNLLDSGLDIKHVTSYEGLEEIVEVVEKGQDDFVKFLLGEAGGAFQILDEREEWGTYGC